MCGRARLTVSPLELAALFKCEPVAWGDSDFREIRPTEKIPVVRIGPRGVRTLELMRWGLVPWWADDIKSGGKAFNARLETAAERPAFREAWRARRCLVVVDAFYEWSGPKGHRTAHLVQRADRRPIAMAGLWERWADKTTGEIVETCSILTREAEGAIRAIHDRMPVTLPDGVHDAWLSPSTRDARTLVASPAVDELVAFPVLSASPDDALPAQQTMFGE